MDPCYPPSIRDSYLYFKEIKVTSKFSFEAVAGLKQIQRSMAGYGRKERGGYRAYVGFEQSLEIGCHTLEEKKPERCNRVNMQYFMTQQLSYSPSRPS